MNIFWTALMLGALIFIHESGHYMMAKALGVRVEVFSLGFGPRLAGFFRGGTDYRVSLLPLGGYVKMLGESPDETLAGSRQEFMSRTKLERFLVLVMGALLNIVVAVVLVTGLYMQGGITEPLFERQPAVIGTLDPNGAAAAAGLMLRDEVVEVGGLPVPTWHDMKLQIVLNPEKTLDFKVRRDGQLVTVPVTIRATSRERMGIVGIGPWTRMAVAKVEEGSAAAAAGLQSGDVIVSVNGQEFFGGDGYEAFIALLEASAGKPLEFVTEREGSRIAGTVTPVEKDGKGVVGVSLGLPMSIRRLPLSGALPASLEYNWKQAGLLFVTLKKLITGDLSPRTLSGPLEIGALTGEAVRVGWAPFFQFMALVSLQLGVINLLPIPVLDGGHIFILLIEGIMRRDLSMKIKERVLQFGFIMLLLLMGGVIFLDIDKMGFFKNLLGE